MKPEEERESPSVSRRDLFSILGSLTGSVPAIAALTSGAVTAQTHDGHAHRQTAMVKGSYKRQTFDDQQWRTVRVLCDLIIPADERSGSATQAGVPEFLDDWIAFRAEEDGNERLRADIFGGLMWLDRESGRLFEKNFADASADQQKQILDRIAYPARAAAEDHAWMLFFNQFRSLTVSGFYSSKIGISDLPYLGNTAVMEWRGCDPQVWAIIEDRMKNGYEGIVKAKPVNPS